MGRGRYDERYDEANGRFGERFGESGGRGAAGPGRGFGTAGPPVDGRAARGPQEGAVLMVYGLNMDKMNADRLFNLLCLYGNVFKVK